MKRIILLAILILSIASCKTLGIQKQETNQIELATIGTIQNSITKASFKTQVIPKLTHKIRVKATLQTFNKKRFKAFKEANKQLGKNTNLIYVDSLENKPSYLKLVVFDKVGLLEVLNNNENNNESNYLKNNSKSQLITEIDVQLSNALQNSLLQAEEIYLIQHKIKKYALELNTNKTTQIINLDKATIFGYKAVSFCWGINDKHQIKMVDISNKCQKGTYKTYQKAKKKNEFSFIKL